MGPGRAGDWMSVVETDYLTAELNRNGILSSALCLGCLFSIVLLDEKVTRDNVEFELIILAVVQSSRDANRPPHTCGKEDFGTTGQQTVILCNNFAAS